MSRPKKCRKVCDLPRVNAFAPLDAPRVSKDSGEEIDLMVEEFETIRLIDHRGLTQEECSRYMNIARTTVQQIYTDARQKIATALVEGRLLRIDGGNYRICDGSGPRCGCGGCGKTGSRPDGLIERSQDTMRMMIPVDEKKSGTGVCPSFGRAPYYMLFDAATREVVYLDNPAADAAGGAGIKAAQFVADQKADVLLTPRCGENAGEVLKAAGVLLYQTIAGSAEENIAAFEAGTLSPLTQFHEGFHGKQ